MTKSQSIKVIHKQDIDNLVLEHAQEAIYVLDVTGTILFANPVGARYFGMTIEEVTGKNLQDFLPSDQFDNEMEAICKAMAEKEPLSYEHPLFVRGRTFHFSTRKHPMLNDKNEIVAVLSISTDITEKIELEEKTHLQEEKFRELLEATQNSIWEEDFSRVKKYLEILKADGVTDLREFFDKNQEALLHCADLIRVTDVNLAGMLVNGIESKAPGMTICEISSS